MAYIYQATNKINGKKYIGQTSYDKLRKRIHTHLWYAKHKGSNLPFPNALRKYGKENFDWEILEECDNSIKGEREVYWIEKVKPEYNATKGGDGGSLGKPCSEEKKKLIAKGVSKRVQCVETGEVFNSLQEASDWAKVSVATISYACTGTLKTGGGYRWIRLSK
jgi:group I intron endonuclease